MRFSLRFLAPVYMASFIIMGVAMIIVAGIAFFFTGKPYEVKMNYPSA